MKKLDEQGFSKLVPMALIIIITFAVLFIGVFINSTIYDNLSQQYGTTESEIENRTAVQNDTLLTMGNTSGNWDATLNILQVVIIITVLAAAIGAIFLFTRYQR